MFVIIDTPSKIKPPRMSETKPPAIKVLTKPNPPVFPEGDGYMTKAHIAYFKKSLTNEKQFLESELQSTQLTEREAMSDPLDCAAQAQDQQAEALGFNRMVQRLREVDQALLRLDEGDFGYCEHSGEEIGLQRLAANPTARLSVEAQERFERQSTQIKSRGGLR